MINVKKNTQWYRRCSSCQQDNIDNKIFDISIGTDSQQTTTVLCQDCLKELTGKINDTTNS